MTYRKKLAKKILESEITLRAGALVTGQNLSALRRVRATILTGQKSGLNLRTILEAMGREKRLEIVQVGANDGKTGDPIFALAHQYAGRILLVEPQPWLIDELRENYKNFAGDKHIENGAITNSNGTLDLHILHRDLWGQYIENVGRHPSAIFSPDRQQVLRRVAPRLRMSPEEADEVIEHISVPSYRLEDIMRRQNFEGADVVQIDCEGHDFEVIQSLGDVHPPIINFESFNLSKETWERFMDWTTKNDYGFIKGSQDTLCIRGFPARIV